MQKPSIIPLPHHQQEHSASCLAACVVMVLAHWQVELDESEIRRIIKTKPYSGTHPVNLLHLHELGFDAWPFEGTDQELRQRVANGEPAIVFLAELYLPCGTAMTEADLARVMGIIQGSGDCHAIRRARLRVDG